LKYRDVYFETLVHELEERKNYLKNEKITTIYLGGGTPSVLSEKHLAKLLEIIHKNYLISSNPEITIEANPDDLSAGYIKGLIKMGFNRISIGIQSFIQRDLELMRRSHSASQAVLSIECARQYGFNNINVDLIYGLPNLSLTDWEQNISRASGLPIEHISAYHLSYESGTVFHHWKKQGKIDEVSEEHSINQFKLLKEITANHGFEHYEISNFAKKGYRSKHNYNYWKGINYIGFGPSAHSYNGMERRWNISSLKNYIERIAQHERYYENELLSVIDHYHDYILTSLRTIEGADLHYIRNNFGETIFGRLISLSADFELNGDLLIDKEILKMTPSGWLKSDLIFEKLMMDEDIT